MSAQFIMITTENNTAIQNENGDILVQSTLDKKMTYMKYEIAAQIFGFENPNVNDSQIDLTTASTTSSTSHANKSQSESMLSPRIVESTQSDRNRWDRQQILQLIEAYKNHKLQFQSTVMKNEKVWQMVSAEVGHHTTDQCMNKFKYLKAAYMQQKDNMSSKRTGAERIKFDYLEEFDAIFGNDANVKPVAVASSSKGRENIALVDESDISNKQKSTTDDNCTFDTPKRRKRSLLEKQLMSYESNIIEREQRREQQHKDKMDKQDKATAALSQIADCFMIYVGKKKSNDDKEN